MRQAKAEGATEPARVHQKQAVRQKAMSYFSPNSGYTEAVIEAVAKARTAVLVEA